MRYVVHLFRTEVHRIIQESRQQSGSEKRRQRRHPFDLSKSRTLSQSTDCRSLTAGSLHGSQARSGTAWGSARS